MARAPRIDPAKRELARTGLSLLNAGARCKLCLRLLPKGLAGLTSCPNGCKGPPLQGPGDEAREAKEAERESQSRMVNILRTSLK